ncbi:MAG: DUF3098 domain-containing protein [Muribaculum sp.]|nr:DUF3098 domain-containing protein [Muribaculum sp.]
MKKTSNIDNVGQGLSERSNMPLSKANFAAMAAAGILIVIGFLLMLGGSSTVDAFNPDIFSTRRIVVGPFIAFIGFVAMAVAIIIDPKHLRKS